MKIVPLADKVVVKRLEAEEKTPGGIVLPDVARKKVCRGKVLSVGDGQLLQDGKRVPIQVKEGETVIFQEYTGTEITVEGEKLLVLSEAEILAVVKAG